MNYDGSNTINISFTERTNDKRNEGSPSEAVAPAVGKTRVTARNWAWAHSNESYDWMDSHSPSSTQESVH
ncbi:hypothetical protein [Paraburkholderia haematera]|jgi:hypothetical protein|uniref:Uncharacterized protein n=1 Tax=Paraburkholderia haematera TaxID=2793077 RepID=A0ABM8RFA3_9BURK|nr:hypothetical protein [Paraburkholderia haematera]CAE6749363.1 hypothetical protein R69888_02898 [Paraburkholderia haematera]